MICRYRWDMIHHDGKALTAAQFYMTCVSAVTNDDRNNHKEKRG